MKETKLEITPTCHFELAEFSNSPATLTLDYVEHCPIAGGSDSDTSIGISKTKAKEIAALLLSYAHAGNAGMYEINEPTYPQVKAGQFTICRQDDNSLWIQCEDGEGSQFPDSLFESFLAEFYNKHF